MTAVEEVQPLTEDIPASIEEITADGVYDALTDEQYHGQKTSLSSSGARQLLPPSCPAKFRWEQDNGRAPKRAWDLGHAAHQKVLGVGAELVVVQTGTKDGPTGPAEDYRTKYAQQHRDEIRAAGAVPILASELEVVDGMAAAIREHPIASVLFDPDLGGQPEQSLFWTDPTYGVRRRARLDWRPPTRDDGRLIVPDFKTTTSVERRAFAKSVQAYGYHVQAVFYTDLIRALDLAEDVAFVFVAQEKSAPYLVSVFELDDYWLRIGRADVDLALATYAECQSTGVWPGYSTDVEQLAPPSWLMREYEDVVA